MDKTREQFEVNGKISDELYEWLLARERAFKVRDKFSEEGNHISLKLSVSRARVYVPLAMQNL